MLLTNPQKLDIFLFRRANIYLLILLIMGEVFLEFSEFIKHYLFNDPDFLVWLSIAIFLDLVTGITKVLVNQGVVKVTSKAMRATLSKVIQYGSFLIITHVLTNFTVDGKVAIGSLDWIDQGAYKLLLLIEAKSVYENLSAINPKFDFLKIFIEKISEFIPKITKRENQEEVSKTPTPLENEEGKTI